MIVLSNVVAKAKVGGIRSQQIRESSGIQPINEWVERTRRREWDERVTIMDAERRFQVIINIPVGRRSPGRLKTRWNNLIPG